MSEDSQLEGPVHIFNKIIKENFPNLKKEINMNIQETYKTLNSVDQKTPNTQNKKRILKEGGGKGQITYKGRPTRITPDLLP